MSASLKMPLDTSSTPPTAHLAAPCATPTRLVCRAESIYSFSCAPQQATRSSPTHPTWHDPPKRVPAHTMQPLPAQDYKWSGSSGNNRAHTVLARRGANTAEGTPLAHEASARGSMSGSICMLRLHHCCPPFPGGSPSTAAHSAQAVQTQPRMACTPPFSQNSNMRPACTRPRGRGKREGHPINHLPGLPTSCPVHSCPPSPRKTCWLCTVAWNVRM